MLKGIVYAGGDGILTTLAIISGAYGGNLSNGIVLTIGASLSPCRPRKAN